MNNKINYKGLVGTFAFASTASFANVTSGILAYIMLTYSEVSATNVTMILTIPAIIGTFFAFISGSLINKIGIKKVAIFVQSCAFASGMIYLFFGNKTSIAVLYVAAAFYGFMTGGSAVTLSQLFKQCVPDDSKRGTFLGYGNSLSSLGGVIASTVGGVIAALNNGAHWERAYLLFFWMLFCLILEIIFLPDPKNVQVEKKAKDKNSGKVPFKVWLISIHYLLFFLFLYAFSLNISAYVITEHQLGTSAQSGLALSCLTVGGIISGLTFGTYSKLLKKKTITFLQAICSIGLGLIIFIPNIYVLYVASALLGFSMMGCNPYVVMELSRITDEPGFAKSMSIYAGFMNGGMMVAVYILAALSTLFFGSADNVDGKFMIAFVGLILVTILSIPLYGSKDKNA